MPQRADLGREITPSGLRRTEYPFPPGRMRFSASARPAAPAARRCPRPQADQELWLPAGGVGPAVRQPAERGVTGASLSGCPQPDADPSGAACPRPPRYSGRGSCQSACCHAGNASRDSLVNLSQPSRLDCAIHRGGTSGGNIRPWITAGMIGAPCGATVTRKGAIFCRDGSGDIREGRASASQATYASSSLRRSGRNVRRGRVYPSICVWTELISLRLLWTSTRSRAEVNYGRVRSSLRPSYVSDALAVERYHDIPDVRTTPAIYRLRASEAGHGACSGLLRCLTVQHK